MSSPIPVDPTIYEDFVLYTGTGDLPPDPDAGDPDPRVEVPTTVGLRNKVRSLGVGEFVAMNVPDAAKQTIARRMDTVGYKVRGQYPERKFTCSTEWFGVSIRRIK